PSPSASAVVGGTPSWATVSQPLSASSRYWENLVASPKHSGSTPVASGSRLPVCPAFSALSSQRTFCRAWLELMPRGLSSTRMPLTLRRIRFTCATSVVPMLAVFGHGTLDQRRQMRTAGDALVEMETQLRHAAQLHRLAQQHAQVAGGLVKDLQIQLDLIGIVLTHQGDEHLGMAEIAADLDGGDGDEAQARVADLARDHLRQLALHLVADTLGTAVFFGHFSYLSRHLGARVQKRQTPGRA